MAPEWKRLPAGSIVDWCAGCGCLRIYKDEQSKPRYRTPKRERDRRIKKKKFKGEL